MKYILTFLFFLLFTNGIFAKGGSGTYFITGKVFVQTKTILKNIELKIKIGIITKTIKTDEYGNYEIEIPWESACPSGRTKEQNKRDNKRINVKYIYFSYLNKKIKLFNEWKKYAQLFPESKEKITRKQDLNFI